MPTTKEHFQGNSKLLQTSTVIGTVTPQGQLTIGENTGPAEEVKRSAAAFRGRKLVLVAKKDAAQQVKENLATIDQIIDITRELQSVLPTKIHDSILKADYAVNGGDQTFDEYIKKLLATNPSLANELVLTAPIPNVISVNSANQFSQFLEISQLLTKKDGSPIKNKVAKLDKTKGDDYRYLEYPAYKAIEAFHHAFLADPSKNQAVNLTSINEFRFSGLTSLIEINLNKTDVVDQAQLSIISQLKAAQLVNLKKILIANLNGNVRIDFKAFEGYNLPELEEIEIRNVHGSVTIEPQAFSNVNMPKLKRFVLDEVTEGVRIGDQAFSNTLLPALEEVVFVCIKKHLFIGNNVFPKKLVSSIRNLSFQGNTGKVTILDDIIKQLLHMECCNLSGAIDNDFSSEFQWIKNKLDTLEELVICGRDPEDLKKMKTQKSGQTKVHKQSASGSSSKLLLSILFLGIAGGLLWYVISKFGTTSSS